MAEYIDKNKLDMAFVDRCAGDCGCCSYWEMESYGHNCNLIHNFPPADVVEREEYDLLKHQLADAWNRIDELDKLNGNMREKIDKAIEEMKALVDPQNTILGFNEKMGLMAAMNILVRNIGE